MKKIPLTGKGKGLFTLVDDEDFERVNRYKWHLSIPEYPTRSFRINYKRFNQRLHGLIMGQPPVGYEIDHINRDKLDNRKENLRFVTHSENLRNGKLHSTNTSGYNGVARMSGVDKWRAYCTENGKQKHIGYFSKKSDAIIARKIHLDKDK